MRAEEDAARRIAPGDLVGTWRLIGGDITRGGESMGRRPYGPHGLGMLTLTADGRMLAVLVDARPADGSAEREYASYCGHYTFDGAVLLTTPFAWSHPRFAEPQRRRVSMRGGLLVLRPPPSETAGGTHQRELVWERISDASACADAGSATPVQE